MRYYVQNIETDATKSFASLRKACLYAYENKKERFDTNLVHIGFFNLEYAESYTSFDEYYKACRKVLKTRV